MYFDGSMFLSHDPTIIITREQSPVRGKQVVVIWINWLPLTLFLNSSTCSSKTSLVTPLLFLNCVKNDKKQLFVKLKFMDAL